MVLVASVVSLRRRHLFSWDGSGCRRRILGAVDAMPVWRLGLLCVGTAGVCRACGR